MAFPRPHRPMLGTGFALVGVVLALGGCSEDPVNRPGTWRPAGVNAANLQAQIADPADLQRGRSSRTDRGTQGTLAVTALETGKRPAVPTTALTPVGGTAIGVTVSSGGGDSSR